ncbi:MAG: hypothetical protein C4557_05365 [Anaerolineaceae bacterium]|jgi:hypothetical protein|nr:MAG: hypothetical protein C4557_05365 [Anaerolineaceae bacterium]
MTEVQTITFGGVMVLLMLRQPIIAIAWILSVALGVLPDEMLVPGIVALIFISLFLVYKREADK